jgi:exodeoxyribonuclease VII small subunit
MVFIFIPILWKKRQSDSGLSS